VNYFDFATIHWINQFAHRSFGLDAFVTVVEESNLLKGGVSMAFFWWAWFRYRARLEKRELILLAFTSSTLALLFGRAVALLMPFRERPLRNPLYHFQIPYTVSGTVHSWNSSPSDHAVLFFCLATCLWMIARPLGIMGFLHAVLVVSLPRIYVGYHYPTDILAGAIIGIGAAYVCKLAPITHRVTRSTLRWIDNHSTMACAVAFLCTFEVAELFESLLNMQHFARQLVANVH
jgi:undecaprenyl-diphosphatase